MTEESICLLDIFVKEVDVLELQPTKPRPLLSYYWSTLHLSFFLFISNYIVQ